CFFFSSRRGHTRSKRDWSSDVCSSDLDKDYLLYWIYNGHGEFEESMDKAKFLDDPQLIMYGLIKQIEQAKNDPSLEGSERDELRSEERRVGKGWRGWASEEGDEEGGVA